MTGHDFDIDVSLTARSKEFRYLDRAEMRRCVRDPPGDVFYDNTRDQYLLRVRKSTLGHNRQQRAQDLFLIVSAHDDEMSIITQTSDHYDLSEYDRLSAEEWPPERSA